MAKRLNKNLVVGLTLAGMLLTTAAGVVAVKSLPQKSAKQFVEQAEELKAKKEYAHAAQYYSRAAQRARSASDTVCMAQYLTKAGELFQSAGDANSALKAWNMAVVTDPSQTAAQEKIVGFMLELARLSSSQAQWAVVHTEAAKLVDAADKAKTKNYVGLHALGCSLVVQRSVREGNLQEGVKDLTEAFNGDKGNADYARSLAESYLVQANDAAGRPAEANQHIKDAAAVFQAALDNAPKDPEKQGKIWLYRGQFFAQPQVLVVFPDADKLALEYLQKAVDLAPKDEDVVTGLGDFWHIKKQVAAGRKMPPAEIEQYRKKAQEKYEQAIQADPDHYTGYLQLANLLLEDKHYDEALKVLDQRLNRPINREHYLHTIQNKRYMAMVRETAFKTNMSKFGAIVDTAPADEKARTAPVIDRMNQIAKDTEAESGEKDPLGLFMRARVLYLQNKTFEAMKTLEEAEKLTPGDTPEIQRLLGMLYLRVNSPGAADKALNIALSANPTDAGALVMLAIVKNQLNEPEQAIQAVEKVLTRDPNNQEALRAKATAFALMKNYEGLQTLNKLLMQGKSGLEEKLNSALEMHQQAVMGEKVDEEKLAKAAALYEQVLKQDPQNSLALQRVLQIYNRKDKPDNEKPALLAQANRVLDSVRADLQKKLEQVAASQPAGTDAATLSRQVMSIDLFKIAIDPSLSDDQKLKQKEAVVRRDKDAYSVAIMLMQLHREAGRLDEAMLDAKEAYRNKPDDGTATESLLQFAIAQKDWKLAEDVADKAVASGVEKSGGHMYRGAIWMARTDKPNNFAEAEREFRAAVNEIPDFAEAHAQLGNALLNQQQQSRRAEARAEYEKALQLNPRTPYALIGMALIADADGRQAEKDQYLQRANQVVPQNGWVQDQMKLREEELVPEKGIERRKELLKTNPKDFENVVRLAELYSRLSKFDDAAKIYELALKLQPNNLLVVAVYANLLISKNPPDVPAARTLIEKTVKGIDAKEKQSKSSAQLLYAAFLQKLQSGQGAGAPTREEVDKAHLEAIQLSPTFEVYMDVARYFIDTQRAPEAIKYYRQAMSAAEAAGRNDQRKTAQQYVVDLLLRTITPQGYQDTVKEIADYRQRYPDESMGIIFSAEFAATTGHDDEASKFYSEYITRNPDSPLGYFRRTITAFRHSDWDACIKDLQEAKQRLPRPDSGRRNTAFEEQIRMLLVNALEQNKQTEAALAELVSVSDAMPNSSATERLFGMYLQMKRFDNAENLVNARARQSSNQNSAMWDILRGKIAIARGNLEGALESARLAAEKSGYTLELVQSYLSLLLEAKRFDEAIAYVEQKLPPKMREDLVAVHEASAYAGKGDIAKAMDLYEKAASTPPVDLVYLAQIATGDKYMRSQLDPILKELEARYQKNPKGRSIRFVLSVFRRVKGDYAGSAELVRGLADESKEDTPASSLERTYLFQIMGTLMYEQKKWTECREWYLKALAKNPKDRVSLNNLAYLLMDQLKDPQAALQYVRQAADLTPDAAPQKPGILDTLGWNLVLLGQYDEAISRLGRTMELNTRIGEAHYHLTEAFYRRSQQPGQKSAAADVELAKREVLTAYRLMAMSGQDPDNVMPQIKALADTLGVKLPTVNAPASAPAATLN